MKILVTGGAGFIGSHLADILIKNGHYVVIVDNISSGKKRNINARAKFSKLDIISPNLSKLFDREKPQIVFHLAAQMNVRISLDNPIFDAQNNIIGSLNLFEQCVKHHVKKVIFASSGGAIYGDAKKRPTSENYPPQPSSPYGIAKFTCEQYMDFYKTKYGLNSSALRLSNVYGPRQNHLGEAGVVAIFSHNIKHGEQSYIYGDGKQTRDFVYVADVVDAFIKTMLRGSGVYNVGTGKETSINQLFKKIAETRGLTSANAEIIHKLPKHKPPIKGEVRRSVLDFKKIHRELGWKSKIDLEEGLRKTAEYLSKT